MHSKIESIRIKQKNIILLVDNRKDNETANKYKAYDFRSSAFKQTQVDPLQPRPDLLSLSQEDNLIFNLKRRVTELEKRVSRLESQTIKQTQISKGEEEESKKKRRKFIQMARDFKCPHTRCQKIYGSETSLKNHIKLKHKSEQGAN